MRPVSNVGLAIKLSPAEQTRVRQFECAHGTHATGGAALPDCSESVGKGVEDIVQKISRPRTNLEQINPGSESRTHLRNT
jgi:hypothetical protein